jgi:single-stranded-DNA-specific exonuclease
MKKSWEIYPPNHSLQETFSRVSQFLHPSLSHLHSPFLMKDMDKAVDRVVQALSKKEQVLICGDYDVDGITSTAIMVLFFQALQLPCHYYIPHRVNEGYGLHHDVLVEFAQQGGKLVITVDCGISSRQIVPFPLNHWPA